MGYRQVIGGAADELVADGRERVGGGAHDSESTRLDDTFRAADEVKSVGVCAERAQEDHDRVVEGEGALVGSAAHGAVEAVEEPVGPYGCQHVEAGTAKKEARLVVVRLVYVREQIAFRMGVDLVETALDEVVEELVAGT